MGGFNRVFLFNNVGSAPDRDDDSMETSEDPTDVYIVLHDIEQQCPFDARYSNYYYPSRLGNCRKNTEILSVHHSYDDAAWSASKYVKEVWKLDEEDEEWLQQLDWQGENSFLNL